MSLAKIHQRDRGLAKYQVAFLASEGLTQKRIAATLGFSQSTVSLLLQEATNPSDATKPILDPRPRFLAETTERIRVQNSLFVGELEEVLREYCKRKKLDIVPQVYLGLTEGEGSTWDQRVQTWGHALGPTIATLLGPAKSITVSWGRQIRSIIDGLDQLQLKRRESEEAVVFSCWPPRLSVRPESHDTIYDDHIALETNALAFDLTEVLNGRKPESNNTLHYLPGIDLIPFTKYSFELDLSQPKSQIQKEIADEEKFLEEVKSAFFSLDSYQSIFGKPEGRTDDCLLRNVDAAILGAGPPGGGKSFAMGENYGGIPQEWYREKTCGDIGGVLFHKKQLKERTSKEKLQFERVKKHWMGLTQEDLSHIAKNGAVGNIVAAVGKDRVSAILFGIDKQYVNHLCCDYMLANALTEQLKIRLSDK